MKLFFNSFLVFLFLISLLEAQNQSSADLARKLDLLKAYPDLIIVNAKIYTMDQGNRQVQAMAVKNHRILALGTNDEIRFLAGPKSEILDAKGRTVLPGLIDGHTHPHMWAVGHWLGGEGDFAAKRYNDPQLQIFYTKGNDGPEVLRSLEQIVQERARTLGPGKWILVVLFAKDSIVAMRDVVHPLFLQGPSGSGTINTDFLDRLAPSNPLLVFSSEAIGPSASNTLAKEQMRHFIGSESSGIFGANVVYDILLRGRTEEIIDLVKREMLTCLSPQGVTTYGNHYYGVSNIMKIHLLMEQRGELPVRWAWWLGGSTSRTGSNADQDPYSYYRSLGDFRQLGNDYIWNAGIGNEGWEQGLICTAATPPPNSPKIPRDQGDLRAGLRPSCSDPINYEQQGGYRNVLGALRAGLRIGFLHHYSDGTFDALFNAIEQAMADGSLTLEQVRQLRISTEHTPIIRPDQIAKIAKYNIMPAFNGYQVQGNIKGGAFLKTYGEQHISWLAPMKSVAAAGAHPVFNTDAHLFQDKPESKPMDWPQQWDGNIWAFLEFFVTRRMPNDGITYNRAEALERTTLMKAATIWGAEQLLNEENIGSLEVGKLADFIVLDKDFFTIPEDQIHTIKTLLTSVGGKTVFKDSSY